MQRNFDGMRKQVEGWRETQLTDVDAKLTIYRAFVESDLEVPRHLLRPVHDLYFHPQHDEFQTRTLWSLSNAFTSAFKQLDPIPQFRGNGQGRRFSGTVVTIPRFPLGQVVATRGVLEALKESGESPSMFVARHLPGD